MDDGVGAVPEGPYFYGIVLPGTGSYPASCVGRAGGMLETMAPGRRINVRPDFS